MTGPAWVPEHVAAGAGGGRCRWVDVAGLRFTDPFLESTLARRPRGAGHERWSTFEALLDEAAAAPPLPPAAFIFHVSRCGSTLLSQLFALDERAVVLSEAPVLDQILRSGRADRERLFTAALRLLGRPRFGERYLVVKTDCWHLFYADVLRRMYPEASFVLLYRSPAAVLGSQRRMRGTHMVPGLLENPPFHVAFDPARTSLDEYAARVLERHVRAMVDLASTDPRCLLVSCDEGFPAAFLRAARWLGVPLDDDGRRRVADRCGHHAKRPHEPFAGDAAACPHVDFSALDRLVAQLDRRRRGPDADCR